MKDLVIFVLGILLVWLLVLHAAEPNRVAQEEARTGTAQQQVQVLQTRVAAYPTPTARPCNYYSYGNGCSP